MPFGLTNAPSTYQRLMECVLRHLTYKICLIYLDDILVYSKTFSDHLLHLRQVLERLRAANLKLKPSKCRFACNRVHYLGHVVSAKGIAPDEDKIEAVRGFPRPRNVKTTRSFLGLASCYRRLVKDFAKLAARPPDDIFAQFHPPCSHIIVLFIPSIATPQMRGCFRGVSIAKLSHASTSFSIDAVELLLDFLEQFPQPLTSLGLLLAVSFERCVSCTF